MCVTLHSRLALPIQTVRPLSVPALCAVRYSSVRRPPASSCMFPCVSFPICLLYSAPECACCVSCLACAGKCYVDGSSNGGRSPHAMPHWLRALHLLHLEAAHDGCARMGENCSLWVQTPDPLLPTGTANGSATRRCPSGVLALLLTAVSLVLVLLPPPVYCCQRLLAARG